MMMFSYFLKNQKQLNLLGFSNQIDKLIEKEEKSKKVTFLLNFINNKYIT